MCDVQPWIEQISSQKIPISAFLDSGAEAAIETKLADYVTALKKEGVMLKVEKFGLFLRGSISKSHVIDYTFDPEELRRIDQLRHELAHHRKAGYTVEEALKDTAYLYKAAFHFLSLAVIKYDLHAQSRPAQSPASFEQQP